MTAPQWRPIPEWEGLYEVSDDGLVKTLPRATVSYGGRVWRRGITTRRGTPNDSGHRNVTLRHGSRSQTVGVHRLVLLAFVGPAPIGTEACHNNGDPDDNRLANLRWDSRSANVLDRVKHGVHPLAQRDTCAAGHDYTPENTRLINDGRARVCRACQRQWAARRRARLAVSA